MFATGSFRAPLAGVYVLSVFYVTRSDHDSDLAILVNNDIACGADATTNNDHGACSAVLELQVHADDVHARVYAHVHVHVHVMLTLTTYFLYHAHGVLSYSFTLNPTLILTSTLTSMLTSRHVTLQEGDIVNVKALDRGGEGGASLIEYGDCHGFTGFLYIAL